MSQLRIFGRSSSVFTRVALIFAHELSVPYQLQVVPDLLSRVSADYGDNPALKMPTLETGSGRWFGTLNICRELARRSAHEASVVWPEDVLGNLAANAQELVLQGMATEVTLILSTVRNNEKESPYQGKNRVGLQNTLAWLEEHLPQVLEQLPAARSVSFFEVTLFCFIMHLEFRKVLDPTGFLQLSAFCAELGRRASARATPFRFD